MTGNPSDTPSPWDAADARFPAEPTGERDDQAEVLEAEMVEELDPEFLEQLEKLRRPTSSWMKTVSGLLISILLFVALGFAASPVLDITILIGVLLLHETGHFLAMRWYGYEDLRMFFIPFFGAAVSGRKTGASSCQEAIVVLAGPLPGLCLSLPLYLLSVSTQTDELGRLALLLAVINGFNLLPVFPMDGGRLLQIILFSRNRYVECGFRTLAALTLLLMGWAIWNSDVAGAWVFCVLGGLMLLGIGPTFTISTIALEMRYKLRTAPQSAMAEIPPRMLRDLVDRVRVKCPKLTGAKAVASMVFQVWEKMHHVPPGPAATILLLGTYLFFIAAMVIVPIVLIVATAQAAMH